MRENIIESICIEGVGGLCIQAINLLLIAPFAACIQYIQAEVEEVLLHDDDGWKVILSCAECTIYNTYLCR